MKIIPPALLLAALALLPSPAFARTETAVLAGGCFWGLEAVFEHVKGVTNVVSGYAGGAKADATYDRVSTERTGHAEAVRITYDPDAISYARLLQVYFTVAHDPGQLNRQGPDTGPSYRSAIFPQSKDQEAAARKFIASQSKVRKVVTKLESGPFFAAEAYHQDFARRNPAHPYILMHDRPKVAALKAKYPQLYRG
ncbi:MAG: peptide-methionine (S)-S-oxide reductase MsrA [Sphingomicrobium sp.]